MILDVNTWIADLTKAGSGAVTVRRALATLQMIFSTEVRDEIIQASPAMRLDKPTVPDHPVTVWEPEYVVKFFDRCGRHRLGALFELVVYTGLRTGGGTADLAAPPGRGA